MDEIFDAPRLFRIMVSELRKPILSLVRTYARYMDGLDPKWKSTELGGQISVHLADATERILSRDTRACFDVDLAKNLHNAALAIEHYRRSNNK